MPGTTVKHTIYFVRHGQCRGNVTGETLPPEEDVITDFGRKQAVALGETLKSVQFTRAYASNYQRAFETAKGILGQNEKSSDLELKSDPRIREREMGDLLGLSAKEIVSHIINQIMDGKKFNEIEIPGGESVEEYVNRQRSFFQELFDSLKSSTEPETILIVSHGLLMRRFLVGINDGSFPGLCTVTNWSKPCASVIQNTSCTTFTVECTNDAPVLTFLKVHEVDHLQDVKPDSNDVAKAHFNVSQEEKMKFIEQILKVPGAKEELSGCVQM